MRATQDVMQVWRWFDNYSMETLTKAWCSQSDWRGQQRTVELMRVHREQYGTSGNCFDLAIWLIDEFRQEKLDCYAILTPRLHVAVVVRNSVGHRYLCDLGDQWIEPILIERDCEDYTEEYVSGFFPGAHIKLQLQTDRLQVKYRRPNGKTSRQQYLLTPASDEELILAGQRTQRMLRTPLVEKRIFTDSEVLHWEFDQNTSFISSMAGKRADPPLYSIAEWAERISDMSGISEHIVETALRVYADQSSH